MDSVDFTCVFKATLAIVQDTLVADEQECLESETALMAHIPSHRNYQCGHGRYKYLCRDCGAGFCEHGKQKNRCKDCGTGFCEHGRQYARCKDCGTDRCQHGRRKNVCKDCGTGYCTHDKQKYRCKDCKIKESPGEPYEPHGLKRSFTMI
jgi:hypothetical protein